MDEHKPKPIQPEPQQPQTQGPLLPNQLPAQNQSQPSQQKPEVYKVPDHDESNESIITKELHFNNFPKYFSLLFISFVISILPVTLVWIFSAYAIDGPALDHPVLGIFVYIFLLLSIVFLILYFPFSLLLLCTNLRIEKLWSIPKYAIYLISYYFIVYILLAGIILLFDKYFQLIFFNRATVMLLIIDILLFILASGLIYYLMKNLFNNKLIYLVLLFTITFLASILVTIVSFLPILSS